MKNKTSKITQLTQLIRLQPFNTSTSEGRSAERYRLIVLNSFTSILARIALAGLGLLIIPLIMNRFGKEHFGLWATITATTTWFTLFDLGIVNGLVIAVSEAFGKGDNERVASYVGTAFIFLTISSLVLGAVLLCLVFILPLGVIFSSGGSAEDSYLRLIVLAAALPLILSMPFTIVRQVYAGYQKAYIGNLFSMSGSLVTMGAVYSAIKSEASLPIITALYVGIPGITLVINYLILTRLEMTWLSFKLSQLSSSSLKRLLRSSIPLLLFQLGAVMVNQTQPIVLAHRSSLSVVADYSVVIRLQQAIISVIIVSTIAFSPSFREASERGDREWVRRAFYKMVRIRFSLAVIFGLLLIFAGNYILGFWLGNRELSFGVTLWISLAVLTLASTWVTAYSDLLVIMDKIWIQVVLVIGNGLSILLLTYMLAPSYGVLGAVIATSVFSLLVLSWLMPMLARSILAVGSGIEVAES